MWRANKSNTCSASRDKPVSASKCVQGWTHLEAEPKDCKPWQKKDYIWNLAGKIAERTCPCCSAVRTCPCSSASASHSGPAPCCRHIQVICVACPATHWLRTVLHRHPLHSMLLLYNGKRHSQAPLEPPRGSSSNLHCRLKNRSCL